MIPNVFFSVHSKYMTLQPSQEYGSERATVNSVPLPSSKGFGAERRSSTVAFLFFQTRSLIARGSCAHRPYYVSFWVVLSLTGVGSSWHDLRVTAPEPST